MADEAVVNPIDPADLETARRLLGAPGADVVVLTGAGISTDSGIPDFRGPNGVWTKNPEAEKLATLDLYLADADIRRRAWQNRLRSEMWRAVPNAGHHALVDLERRGALHTLITQNIDGLHQAAGSDPAKVVEAHGTIHEVTCMSCGDRGPMRPTLDRVEAGEDDPRCLLCHGILKSATISFGQNLVEADILRAFVASQEADVFLAVGTSLAVYPIANTVQIAIEAGAALVIVNAEPTPYDDIASVLVTDGISEALPRIVG
jgi:NAD-dependent deacetylase